MKFTKMHGCGNDYVYVNCFEETVEDSDVHFHYQLKQGPCSTRNALTLLELTGYDENTVRSAKEAAKEFQNTGIWKKMKGV